MNPKAQVALIAISIAFGVGYQLIQNLRIASGDPIPIWPHLTIPSLISCAAAHRRWIFRRDFLLARGGAYRHWFLD